MNMLTQAPEETLKYYDPFNKYARCDVSSREKHQSQGARDRKVGNWNQPTDLPSLRTLFTLGLCTVSPGKCAGPPH